MSKRGTLYCALVCGAVCGATFPALAESVSDYAVRVSATVQTNPPLITLSWPADPGATGYTVHRKLRDDPSWGTGIMLAANATNYVDSNVVVGSAYEYNVSKSASTNYYGEGYIYAGIQAPLVESRGKVVLLVDNTFTSSLAMELARLQQDLVGDGWTVLRHDVPRMAVDPANTSSNVWAARSNELVSVKALITTDYNADTTSVRAVFLLGHVPVPYSGKIAPDGHPEHIGAWPADMYYGDMSGLWTDSTWNTTTASDTRNWNVRGDGKFDQPVLPGTMTLQVGRVDLANLPAFTQGETNLLRQYLNKDHNFRHKLISAERRGWIDDHFGVSGAGAPVAVNGWRNFAPFFGASNSFAGSDWFGTLASHSYLWGYGCGGGTFTSCGGVGSTTDFVTKDPQVVFTMFFGSWFGDWDSQNNFLRAALATTNYTLTSAWVGRPYWQFHHMALGETIGFSTRLSQNNSGLLYDVNSDARSPHIALMGDPTLRMHPVAPLSNLVVVSNGSSVDLSWNASPDPVVGYAVYRAVDPAGPYTRLNPSLATGTNLTVAGSTATNYMVRAVNLEVSGSGSYTNASQGIFQTVSIASGPPVLTITAQNTNKVFGAPLPAFTALYSGFVNGDTTNDLTSQAAFSTTATETNAVGSYPITASGASSSSYTLHYVPGTLTVTPAATGGVVTSSVNPSLPSQPVSFTMTLSAVAPGVGTPSGTVQFKIDGTNAGGPVSLSGGTASYTTSALTHGTHMVVAEYAGDGNFTGTTNVLSPNQLINTPPVAGGDILQRDPTNGVKVSVAALLSNDTDADGDSLTFLGASATSAHSGTVVSNGGWIFYTSATGFTNSDTFTYTIGDGYGAPVTGTVTVNIRVDNGLSMNLTISDLGNGSYAIRGDGIPGRTYRIQFAVNLDIPDWQTLGTATADPFGIFAFTDLSGPSQRYYRSVYP